MHLSSVAPKRGVSLTPLRYPGGKARLADFLESAITKSCGRRATYFEPFAGGAGAALALLHRHAVQRIVINDLDPAIYAFWKAATSESSSLIRLVEKTPLTLEEWRRQRETYQSPETTDFLALGFATLYLNRTNRSGIMNAGVIGGQAQTGKYRLDARFNKEALVSQLQWIAASSNRIRVRNCDGLDLLRNNFDRKATFSYIDPPYYKKGSFLYLNSFTESDHAELARLLHIFRDSRWVLTYDDVPEIRRLYRSLYQGTYILPYSAHRAEKRRERMILADPIARIRGILT